MKRLTNGQLILSVPRAALIAPPEVPAPRFTVIEPQGPTPGLDVPIIVTPGTADTNHVEKSFFEQVRDQLVISWFDSFFASILQLHAYKTAVSDDFTAAVAADLRLTFVSRLHVNDEAGRWIDIWRTEDNRQIWVLPGTINKADWLTYANPGMLTVGTASGTLTCYNGLGQNCNAYGAYAVDSLSDRISLGKGAVTIVGHSSGGVAAQFLAYTLNSMYRLANPSGEDYPVGRVVSFGAPAAFNADELTVDFLRGYKHYRLLNPGDPVPYAAMRAYKAATYIGRALNSGDDYRGPRFYDTQRLVIQPDWNAGDEYKVDRELHMLDGRAFENMRLFLRVAKNIERNILQGYYDAQSHNAQSYANRLEIVCRQLKACPYPNFTFLVALNRAQGLQ